MNRLSRLLKSSVKYDNTLKQVLEGLGKRKPQTESNKTQSLSAGGNKRLRLEDSIRDKMVKKTFSGTSNTPIYVPAAEGSKSGIIYPENPKLTSRTTSCWLCSCLSWDLFMTVQTMGRR